MSMARRAALLDFARRARAVVIEDDYDGEFRAEGRPLDALQTIDGEQCVFYVGTFSKSLFPALRMGFVVAPDWARPALLTAKQRTDWHCPLPAQDTLATFITEGHLARHVRKMRAVYRERREQLVLCLERECGSWTAPMPAEVGLHLSVRTDPAMPLEPLVDEAAREGIRVQTIEGFSLARPAAQGLVLGFGAIDATRIASAVRRLGAIAGRVG
jgi:GntR family transcriptional regulator/MocR family aminotransferase